MDTSFVEKKKHKKFKNPKLFSIKPKKKKKSRKQNPMTH